MLYDIKYSYLILIIYAQSYKVTILINIHLIFTDGFEDSNLILIIYTQLYFNYNRAIGIMVRVFTNGLGNQVSIPGWVIPKTQKLYLMPPYLTLSIIRYGSRVKWNNPGNGVAPSPTHLSSSYCKGRLRVTLVYSHQHYLFYILIIVPFVWFHVTKNNS